MNDYDPAKDPMNNVGPTAADHAYYASEFARVQADRIAKLEADLAAALKAYEVQKRISEAESKDLAAAQAENNRLTGKACLVCGRETPCTDAPDACTFDPHPIDAARRFMQERDEAMAEAAALKADAERYRWLRNCTFDKFSGDIDDRLYVACDDALYSNKWALHSEELDAAIDAAKESGK